MGNMVDDMVHTCKRLSSTSVRYSRHRKKEQGKKHIINTMKKKYLLSKASARQMSIFKSKYSQSWKAVSKLVCYYLSFHILQVYVLSKTWANKSVNACIIKENNQFIRITNENVRFSTLSTLINHRQHSKIAFFFFCILIRHLRSKIVIT